MNKVKIVLIAFLHKPEHSIYFIKSKAVFLPGLSWMLCNNFFKITSEFGRGIYIFQVWRN